MFFVLLGETHHLDHVGDGVVHPATGFAVEVAAVENSYHEGSFGELPLEALGDNQDADSLDLE